MNVLFFGDLNSYGRAIYRRNALCELGYKVTSLSYIKINNKQISSYSFFNKILWRLKIPLSDNSANKLCVKYCREKNFDIIWIDNGLLFFPWTLSKIRKIYPKTKIILFSEDDLCVWHGFSLWLGINYSKFSAIFTTKKHNLDELKKYGQKNVYRVNDSYIPSIHNPIYPLCQNYFLEYKSDVSAIGAYEPERASSIEYLAMNGIKVLVWGMGWDKFKNNYPDLMIIKNKFLFSKEYSYAINCTKININFLRKINRDTITSRTIEIPACGGFMISERTDDQQNILIEGAEAEYFSDNAELLSKIRIYLADDKLRNSIAFAGFKKIHNLKYDIITVVENVINITNFKLDK